MRADGRGIAFPSFPSSRNKEQACHLGEEDRTPVGCNIKFWFKKILGDEGDSVAGP